MSCLEEVTKERVEQMTDIEINAFFDVLQYQEVTAKKKEALLNWVDVRDNNPKIVKVTGA